MFVSSSLKADNLVCDLVDDAGIVKPVVVLAVRAVRSRILRIMIGVIR